MTTNILLQIAAETTAAISSADALIKLSSKFGTRFLIDFVSVFILIRCVYFPIYKRQELFFTFFIFNIIIFLICFLLNKVDLSMGAAFGLFAVFSMLRYRTENISLKDMTYLFLLIGMGLMAAVTKIKGASEEYEYLFISVVNLFLIVFVYLLESKVFFKKESSKTILYEKIELIKNEKQDELLADLKMRTGLNIHRIYIQDIDFLKDAATIKIYYYEI